MDKNSFSRETTINIQRLIELANSFGLPYIEESDGITISVVGEKQLLIFNKINEYVFNKPEVAQCQLIEIY